MIEFPDKRFFLTHDPLPVAQIVSLVGGTLLAGDQDRLIERVCSPDRADRTCAIFINSKDALEEAGDIGAGLVFIKPELTEQFASKSDICIVVCDNPRLAFAVLAEALHSSFTETEAPEMGIDASVIIGKNCSIAPSASIGKGAVIGEDCVIGPYALIGQGVVLGKGCRISAHASVTHAILDAGCFVRGGAVIGEAGFGFVSTDEGFKHVPQLGRVLLGREVDIGANTTIDRGALGDTRIGDYTKIDNLIQIAHNVTIGSNCAIAAQTGISGSTDIGDNVMIGGQAGVADHVTIGSNAVIKARAAVLGNVPANEQYGGYPAKPARDWMREIIAVHRLARVKRPERAGKKK